MTRKQQKRMNMLLWSMLTHPIDPRLSWRFLLEWAALGGMPIDRARSSGGDGK